MKRVIWLLVTFFKSKPIIKTIRVIKKDGLLAYFRKAKSFVKRNLFGRTYLQYHNISSDPKDFIDSNRKNSFKWYQKNWKKVTIIVPSYNDLKYLQICIRSIQTTVEKDKVDIIIVDDASTDEEHIAYLDSIQESNIRLVRRKKNGGFSKAANDGLKNVRTTDIILLNSDIEAKQGWLEALQYGAYLNKKIGIVGPKLLLPNGSVQSAGLYRHLIDKEWFDCYFRHESKDFSVSHISNFVLAVIAACMYIKKDVFKCTGFLDDKNELVFKAVDFCLRVWEHGYYVLYCSYAELIYHEPDTRAALTEKNKEKKSKIYFWSKWKNWFDERNVRTEDGNLHIIYVLEDTAIGGGRRVVFEHLNRLYDLGLNVELYSLEEKPDWFPLKVPIRTFRKYDLLIETLSNQEAIKIATWWNTAEAVWLSSVSKGIPVYLVLDIESSYYPENHVMQLLVLSKYKKEFHYMTNSKANALELESLGLFSTIIPCGINENIFKPCSEARSASVLLTPGRSHYLKNLQFTLDAWSQLQDKQPTLWMYGVEPEIIKNYSNCKYFFKPDDYEINVLLNRATVFILTSRHEGFALTILEAMAAGTPVICTDADGNRDFCIDGNNCLIVNQGDINDLKNTIEELFKDADLQNHLRQGGFKTAQKYFWKYITPKLKAFYQDVADGKVTPPASSY